MAETKLRVALEANVSIAGTRLPRWPYEVLLAAQHGHFDLLLPEQVIEEAHRHIENRAQRALLDHFLSQCAHERLPRPERERVLANLDLVRSRRDVPIALALLDAGADVFVTSDRDFTDEGATANRFNKQVRIMLPAVFLRSVLGWPSDALEAIRHRSWREINPDQVT